MNCTDHREWLQTYLDGEAVGEDPRARQHRAGCAECRALFAAAQRLVAGLARFVTPAPPDGLCERVVGCVLGDRRRVLRIRRVAAVVGLAAGILLATFLALPFLRPAPNPEGGRERALVKPPAEPSLDESIQEATAAVVELTQRTTDETVGQTRLLLSTIVPDVPVPDSPLVALSTPVRSLLEVQESVSDGLEPVTTSWRRAVDLFRRNIPPMAATE